MFSLAKFWGVEKVNFQKPDPNNFWGAPLQNYAHVIIDVQAEFCDPHHTSKRGTQHTASKANRIATLTPHFRQTGIKTILVYYDDKNEGIDTACGGLFKLQQDENDILIPKVRNCAFKSSHIHKTLKINHITHLIVSGFNASACVKETVNSGLKNDFNIAVMRDCVGNGKGRRYLTPFTLRKLSNSGAHIIKSRDALAHLRAKQQLAQPA